MKIKTRLIILGICVVVFLIIAPYIVLYSLGYRVDFENLKIRGTGGIYVYAVPAPDAITIDSKIANEASFFSSAVFAQNLIPGLHTVAIKKDGYYDYQKTLLVKEKEVAKLETVLLFKKNIAFTALADIPATGALPTTTGAQQFAELTKQPVENFAIKNKNLYYADVLENAKLSALQRTTPVIKNVLAYTAHNQTITWLSDDGFLYEKTIDNSDIAKISMVPFAIKTGAKYQVNIIEGMTFLQEGSALFFLHKDLGAFEMFYNTVTDLKSSPNNQKIVYFNDHQVLISSAQTNHQDKILLDIYASTIQSIQWLNNDYVVILAQNTITLSEIDARGNINKISFPQPADEIFFNQQDKKLYILTQKNVIVSERLVP